MICKEFFNYLVWREVLYRPKYIRRGQSVFNATEEIYGSPVARGVQFVDGVDCFYDDSQIEAFLNCAYKLYVKLNQAEL